MSSLGFPFEPWFLMTAVALVRMDGAGVDWDVSCHIKSSRHQRVKHKYTAIRTLWLPMFHLPQPLLTQSCYSLVCVKPKIKPAIWRSWKISSQVGYAQFNTPIGDGWYLCILLYYHYHFHYLYDILYYNINYKCNFHNICIYIADYPNNNCYCYNIYI